MGLTDQLFGMSHQAIVEAMFRGKSGTTGGIDARTVRDAGPINIAPSAEGQEFRTPSGRLEFYSGQLAAQGLGLPDWTPDEEDGAQAGRWPLRLLTVPGYFQAHTAYAGVAFLRKREGAPIAILHPDDARSRGLADGQKIKLFNDRGSIGLVLHVSEEIQQGVILVPGQRPDEEAESDTINMLCSARYTDVSDGATSHSTYPEVAAGTDAWWRGPAPSPS